MAAGARARLQQCLECELRLIIVSTVGVLLEVRVRSVRDVVDERVSTLHSLLVAQQEAVPTDDLQCCQCPAVRKGRQYQVRPQFVGF